MSRFALAGGEVIPQGTYYGEQGDAVRTAAADAAIQNYSDELAQPELVADAQLAIVHHIRRDAFDWFTLDGFVKAVLNLDGQIKEVAVETKAETVPVVMSYQVQNGGGCQPANLETALVAVETGEPYFRSVVDHEKDVDEQSLVEPISITTRTLSLVGSAVRYRGLDLADHSLMGRPSNLNQAMDEFRFDVRGSEAFDLHIIELRDGRNLPVPSDEHPFRKDLTTVDRFFSSQRPLVGWEKIVPRIEAGIRSFTLGDRGSEAYKYVSRMLDFFTKVGLAEALIEQSSYEVGELLRGSERFGKVFDTLKVVVERDDDLRW